jgi:hypothetical protein
MSEVMKSCSYNKEPVQIICITHSDKYIAEPLINNEISTLHSSLRSISFPPLKNHCS